MTPLRTSFLSLLCVAMAPLGASLGADAADALGFDALAQDLDAVGAAEAAFIRRGKLKKRQTTGYRVVVVVGDDATTNEVNTVDVQLEPTTGGGEPASFTLPLKVVKANGNKRFVFNALDFPGDVGDGFVMTSTMKDSVGATVGEPDVREVTVDDDGPATVRDVSIRQLDATNFQFRALVVGDSELDVDSVEVIFTDLGGPPAIPDVLSLNDPGRSGGRAIFIDQTLTFEDPSFAADEVYSVIVDLKDATYASLGAAEFEVVVEGLSGGPFSGTCWDGVQNGNEAAIDCGGSCSPCPSVDTSYDLLQELAVAATSDAASQFGLVVEEATVTYEVSPAGRLTWTAGTEDGSALAVIEDSSILHIDGGDFLLQDNSVLLMEKFGGDDGTITNTTTAYNAEGLPIGSWTHVVVVHSDNAFDVVMNGPVVGGPTPTGVVIGPTAKYGDIIMSSMPLDDFYD